LPQFEFLLLSLSASLPVVQPIVQTATDLLSDLANPRRTWKQTASRVAGNVMYGGTKLSVATYKVARSADRWLAKKQNHRSQSVSASCPTNSFHSANDCAHSFTLQKSLADFVVDDDYVAKRQSELEEIVFSNGDELDDVDDVSEVSDSDSETATDVFGNKLIFDEEKNRIDKEPVSIYANQPHSVTKGLRDGGTVLQENIQIAFDALVCEPQRAYKENGGSWRRGATAALYGIPRAILRSATGISGATVKIGHGISNAVDKEKFKQREKKWKSQSYVK